MYVMLSTKPAIQNGEIEVLMRWTKGGALTRLLSARLLEVVYMET